ncbi:MAG: hypothetical protein IIC94_09965 [Chloroflexi bacterium]|nr:hypothetical protein [Chloroflexota bacterium]
MTSYLIEVPVTHTRVYTVEAESPEEAIARYNNGGAEFVDDDMESLDTWEEEGGAAVVLSDDGLHTVLLNAADANSS